MRDHVTRLAVLFAVAAIALPRGGSAQDRYVEFNGIRIRYVEQGTGEPIVLLHGMGGTLETWTTSGILQDLARDHRVIAFDLRGHGKSSRPHDPKQYGREMGLDVVRLLDTLGIARAHIVGYSLGGMITSQLLTLHPERFATATLIAGGGRFDWSADAARNAESVAGEMERDCVSKSLVVALAPPDAPKPTDERMRQLSAECMADSLRDRFAMAALTRSRADQVVAPATLALSKVPTLAIVGSADGFRKNIDSLVTIRPTAKLVVVEGATHAGPRGILTRPELVSALREFLTTHPLR
jgi:pimeloyl-ACP methyl ester carboxylesterase